MRLIIQIYAFTSIDMMLQAVAAGVDHIGFIAGKYDQVHGELDFPEARKMVEETPKTAKSVALTMSTDIEEILKMVDIVNPDILHISSETDAVDLEKLKKLRSRINPAILLMKAIGIENRGSVDTALRYSSVSDILLLDTKAKGFPGVGATGKIHDWNVSREIVTRSSIPVILAGGLSTQNVQSAIHQVHPWGVDSNTSTNIPGDPLNKDISRIRAFIKAVRMSENGESDES